MVFGGKTGIDQTEDETRSSSTDSSKAARPFHRTRLNPFSTATLAGGSQAEKAKEGTSEHFCSANKLQSAAVGLFPKP